MEPALLSIGHSNHPLGAFLALLRRHSVAVLIDVRSVPASRHMPDYGRAPLDDALAGAGIGYRWMGAHLGGRPRDKGLWTGARPDYPRIAASPGFQAAVAEVLSVQATRRVVLMCAERDPAQCHRSGLLAPAFAAAGVDVLHVLYDGQTIPQSELAVRRGGGQQDLFGFSVPGPDAGFA